MISSKKDIPLRLDTLCRLVEQSDLDQIKELVSYAQKIHGKSWWSPWTLKNEHAVNAVRDAIIQDKIAIVTYFLDQGVPADEYAHPVEGDHFKHTFIRFAARAGFAPIAKLLVNSGASLKTDTRDEESDRNALLAMKDAIMGGNDEIIRFFLENGANADEALPGLSGTSKTTVSYLEKAIMDKNFRQAELLIQNGAKIETTIQIWIRRAECQADAFWYEDKELQVAFNLFLEKLFDQITCANIENLHFLSHLNDISDLTFIGISFNGFPINREMLAEQKLLGAEKAIVTLTDLKQISDERRKAIENRLETEYKRLGKSVNDDIADFTPIFPAAKNGNLHAIKARLEAKISPDCFYKRYPTWEQEEKVYPMTDAAENGHLSIVKYLYKSLKKFNIKGEVKKDIINSALKSAKAKGYINIVEYLLMPRNPLEHARRNFLNAVETGDTNQVKMLLTQHKELINTKDTANKSLLDIAISNLTTSHKYFEVFEFIAMLWPVDENYQATTSKMMTKALCDKKYLEAFQTLLLRADKSDKFNRPKTIRYPWYVKFMYDACSPTGYRSIKPIYNSDVLSILIKEHKANLNEKGSNSDSLLMSAIQALVAYAESESASSPEKNLYKEKFSLLEFLLDHGADPRLLNKNGQTALHSFLHQCQLQNKKDFFENGIIKVIACFIKHGANINTQDTQGKTALHLAMSFRNIEIVKFLLEYGADINTLDKDGRSALFYATKNGFHEATKLLTLHNAKPKMVTSSESKETPLSPHVSQSVFTSSVSFEKAKPTDLIQNKKKT